MFLLNFRASSFRCISGCDILHFRYQRGSQEAPKSIQNLKKNRKGALQFNWYVLDAVLTSFWMHFGRHLGGFRSLLVAICYRCWHFWDATWASFCHHRFARCQLWSDTLNSPFLWLGRRAESQEELIIWIAGWMDFWCWPYLRSARPGESRPARPSTVFPPSFDIDFHEHFCMDLASILEQVWTICVSFWHLKLHNRFGKFLHWFSMPN